VSISIKPKLSTGTVTFLFTDIEGSTRLWEEYPEAMQAVLARHDAILRQAVEAGGGHIIKTTGDGVHAVFDSAAGGVAATLTAQQVLRAESWEAIKPQVLRIRMGLHTGDAEARAGDYYGTTLNRAARLMSIAHGGQILLSKATAELVHEELPHNATLLDLGEHRLKDLVRPEHVFQLAHPDLPGEFPPIKSLNLFPNNLPLQLTSFIGRERELREARERLEGARLLTLIGPGGTGKTRMTLQLAADMLPNFVDGVWFVELAPIADPALTLQTVAAVLCLREQMGMPLIDIVLNYLRGKQLLLIFDNCEHLVEPCAQLADQFLHAGQTIKMIASSREALGINGEAVYRVPSLSLPDPEQITLDRLRGYESVQLLVERATAANPRFHLTEKNASAIAQICRRLDGIPLALELAAARLTVFSPEQIAARLDDRFKLLTGGSRTALPRQQTLRALIDWSHDMLTDAERTLFRRLAVFADGWTFEAAEALCPDLDVLSLLTQLVNKSLVAVDDEGSEPRYRLLETVRQYARDKLLESGEVEQVRNRHLEYFHDLAQKAEPELYTADAMRWVVKLEPEHDNIRAAIEWGLGNNLTAVLEMCSDLPIFWFRRGMETESRALITAALSRADTLPKLDGQAADRQTRLLAAVWLSQGFLAFSQGDSVPAIEATQKCASLARQLGDHGLLARALGFEVSAKLVAGDFEDADVLLQEGVAVAQTSRDAFALGMMFGMFGSRLMMVGRDQEAARAYVDQGLAMLEASGNRWGYTMIMLSLGIAAKYMGRFDEARAHFALCLPIFRDMGDRHRVNMVQSELAHMERAEGRFDTARQMYRESIVVWQRLGHRAAVAHQLECLAFIARVRGTAERAATFLGAAEALRERIEIQMTVLERAEYERELAALRAATDGPAFTSAWNRGRAMTMEAAITFALEAG